GNGTFNYSVTAYAPLVFTCATNKTVECGSTWSFDPPNASGGCCVPAQAIVSSIVTTGSDCSYSATATWQATDCCSNSATCSQTVTAVATQPPVLTCATNKTVECGSTWSFDPPSATDACCGTNVTITVFGTVTNSNPAIGPCALDITRTWE